MGATVRKVQVGPRHVLLGVFVATTFVLLGAGLIVTDSLFSSSLNRMTEQDAGREARLVADMGLASALSAASSLSARDLRLAAAEAAAAERDVPLTGVSIWTAAGRPVFRDGSGRADAPRLPSLALKALETGQTTVAYRAYPGTVSEITAAVPLRTPGLHSVAEFHFSRAAAQRSVDHVRDRLLLLTAVAALFFFLGILPLLARLARRVPLPVDPAQRAAIAELRTGLERRELVLHYQPKVELETDRVLGVEALVRWNHPQRGLLAPGEFLPVAEANHDLMRSLSCQVLESAVAACARWRREGRNLPVAVNIPAQLLLDRVLLGTIRNTLQRARVEPRMLTVELTETGLMEQGSQVLEPLSELRALGISISIDDFGTGHSSLSRLGSLPLDELKVDRSFVARIASDERDLGIARHVISLGLHVGLRVVAEGVEDEGTLRLLQSVGCGAAQGFYYSRPLPEEQLVRWLDDRADRPWPEGSDGAAARHQRAGRFEDAEVLIPAADCGRDRSYQ